jgi:GH15 family glucan-1,4-alpha-glucosidase
VQNPPHTLREYALLADGERGILIGPRGDFAWMCFPAWDSDALFSTLIGGDGHYLITPAETYVWGGYYEPGGLIWRSRWVTGDAIVECREALALPSSAGRAVVLRRLVGITGKARMRVVLDPRAGFGRYSMSRLGRDDDGVWRGRLGDCRIAWSGGADAAPGRDPASTRSLVLELDVTAGETHDFVLVIAAAGDDADPPGADETWRATEAEWGERVPPLDCPVASRDARHACAVLTGLTSGGGGMVAAATMSLPERATQGRNYDYRYVWIRDQCYAGQAAAASGQWTLLDDAVRFARDRLLADGPNLRPAYTVRGGDVPDERSLDLPGYPGGADVIGNRVNKQFQLDPFGEALLLFAAASGHDRLDADGWRAVEVAAEAIATRWQEEDAGIWELDAAQWTHGRLIASAGLRAVSGLAPAGERTAGWLALADRILAETSATATDPSGHWHRAVGDPRVDAALLVGGIRRATAPDDPRALTTLAAIEEELTEDGYVYRYRPDERPLGESEGAFLICGFWLSMALWRVGRQIDAARWFERTRTACGPAGLLSEEFDVQQRQLRGNIPQAFVHAALLECAFDQRQGGQTDG